MEDIVQSTATEYVAWTGGKLLPDWSDLDGTAPATYSSPNQFRPLSVAASQKVYNARVQGITPIFSKGGHVRLFKGTLWEALVDRGLDTITSLPDAATKTIMYNVIEDFSCFTLEVARQLVKDQVAEYDAYDISNDKCVCQLLNNNISQEFLLDLFPGSRILTLSPLCGWSL